MKFSIHAIYQQVFKIWRSKRMNWFIEIIKPEKTDTLLDVGGYPGTWTARPPLVGRIDCLNVHPVEWSGAAAPLHHITTLVGDGCALTYPDHAYDIVFSNSVIEHVGTWEQQRAFAAEVRRVGKRLWLQTPAYSCPLEPHFMAPFVHWLPIPVRRRVLRWMTPWGWLEKPSQSRVDETIHYTRLLTKKQMTELFPDCTIVTERLLGIFPKSYVAYRV